MDITALKNDILRRAQEQKQGVKTMFNQSEILNSSVDEVQPHKAKDYATFIWAIPYCLQFPFNPIDPSDITFNAENTYTAPADPVEVIKGIKEAMRENKELHKMYAGYIGISSDGYDISTDEITENDRMIFSNFKKPVQLSLDTQKITTTEAGQYGREFVTELEKDSEGNIKEDFEGHIQARLLNLEQAIVSEKTAEYLLDKDRSNLSKDEKENLNTIRRSKAISYPRKSGIMFLLEWECDAKNQVLKDMKASSNLMDNLRYINCNTDFLKKIMKRVGKKKDRNMSYLLLKVTYGTGKGGDKPEKIALAESREYEYIDERTFEDYMELKESGELKKDPGEDPRPYYRDEFGEDGDFNKIFFEFNNKGLEGEYVKLAKRNVYKFRPIKNEMIKQLFYTRMSEIQKYITEDIFNDFIDLIDMCNEVVGKKLKEIKLAGKLPVSKAKIVSTDEEAAKLLEKANEIDKIEAANYAESEAEAVTDENVDEGKTIGDLVPDSEKEPGNL